MKRGTPENPKTHELAARLGVELPYAIGVLELMWHFTAKFAPQGDIGRYSDKQIAAAVHWQRPTGERGVTPECKLSGALVAAKWLDSDPVYRLVVHDWAEHADQQVIRKLARQKLDFIYPKASSKIAVPKPMPEPEPLVSCSSSEISTTVENHNTQAAAPSALLPADPLVIQGDLARILETFRAFGRGCTGRDLKTCQRLWERLTGTDREAVWVDIQASIPLWRGRPTEKIPQPWNYLEGRYWERNVNRKQPEQEMGKFERGFRKAAAEFIRETSAGGNKP